MSNEPIYPSKCPITGRDFFMVIEHPELGDVPTYGGPFDSYTIPEMEGNPDQPFHLRELVQRRYDHDAGCWKEGVETIPLRVVHDDIMLALEDKLETADGVLRSLSSWLDMGGYSGSEDINYEDMEKRIRDGVDMFISGAIAREKLDAARYRRLQILGAAPGGSNNLEEGTVLCFSALDSFVDDDIRLMPSRGEAGVFQAMTEAYRNCPAMPSIYVEHWDDNWDIQGGVLVTLKRGWSFLEHEHQGAMSFETVTKANDAVKRENIFLCNCEHCGKRGNSNGLEER